MKIYHLSHTDLDGYGAQLVTKHYFKDILFFNSNYGREIEAKFEATSKVFSCFYCIFVTKR